MKNQIRETYKISHVTRQCRGKIMQSPIRIKVIANLSISNSAQISEL